MVVDESSPPQINDPKLPPADREFIGAEPQPLVNVLEKYYKAPSERPISERNAADRGPAALPRPNPIERSETDRSVPQPGQLYEEMRARTGQPVQTPPFTVSRVTEGFKNGGEPLPAFNNHFEKTPSPAPPMPDQVPGVDNSAQTIHYVYQAQFGDYQQRFQQPDYLSRLPTMRLPMLPMGQYRAFEADSDFLFPGAWLIGQFVRNWFEITDGQFYVLLVQHHGILARRVFSKVKDKGTLLLTADKPNVPNREVALKDVLEVWDVKAFVSQQLPPPAPSYDRIRQLADELRYEVERLK